MKAAVPTGHKAEDRVDLSIWNPISVVPGQCVCWRLGDLAVWVQRHEREWHILVQSGKECGISFSDAAVKPDSTLWSHYLMREGCQIKPVPAMADRPVVIRPDRTLILLPGEWAQFFVALPVWFRLTAGAQASGRNGSDGRGGAEDDGEEGRSEDGFRTLFERPVSALTNTWFGDPVNGELCYFRAARLYHEYTQIPLSPVQAVCPIRISNESDMELDFERMCLHTEYLSVYRSPGRLWTNAVSVLFRGPEQSSQILPSKQPPAFDGTVDMVCSSREAVGSWYVKRTFSMLKHFTGF